MGIEELLDAIVERVPPPKGDPDAPLQAMVFDSHYDDYRGAIIYVRLMNGTVEQGQKIRLLKTGTTHEVLELGQFVPQRRACEQLASRAGRLPDLQHQERGRRAHRRHGERAGRRGRRRRWPAIEPPQRMVYCGLYPSDGQNFEELRDALTKLSINDPSFEFEPETSDALGFGFRCGFLGLLHMEIIQQRLEQEADLDLVQTAPNVTYEILTTTGETLEIHNPQDVPDAGEIEEFRQPMVRVNFILPTESIGPVMQLCTDRRGVYHEDRVSFADAGDAGLRPAAGRGDLRPARQAQERDARLRHDGLRAVGLFSGRPGAAGYPGRRQAGRRAVDHLRPRATPTAAAGRSSRSCASEIDRHMFEVALQAAIGSRIIARETISAMRKNVTAKCYGGDITRKRKLWAKQREGKKRMKSIGTVDIPQKAFLAVLETGGPE